jgi:hypothetical protein
MFIVDKVVEEDRRALLANELESITLPDGTTPALGPAARDPFAIFEDLCLLGNGERPQFLQLEYLHKTFARDDLIESVLTNYHELFRKVCLSSPYPSQTCMPAVVLKPLPYPQHSELLLLSQHQLFLLLLKTLSERSGFLLSLHGTRIVFLLLKQFSSEFETEAKVILALLINLIISEIDAGESRSGWMRVLAMEITRG